MSPRLRSFFASENDGGLRRAVTLAIVVALGLVACGKFLDALAVIAAGIPLVRIEHRWRNFRQAGQSGSTTETTQRSDHDDPAPWMQIISGASRAPSSSAPNTRRRFSA